MEVGILRIIFGGLFGLILGSFAGCLSYRYVAGVSVATPARSYCPKCETFLAWVDNIPLLSYCLLRGKCRHCGHLISLQYVFVELSSLICGTLLAIRYEFPLQWLLAMAVLFLLIVSSAVETQTHRVPKFVIWGILAVAIVSVIIGPKAALYQTAVSIGIGVSFAVVHFVISGRIWRVFFEFGALLVGTAAVIGGFAEARLGTMVLIMSAAYVMVVFLTGKGKRGEGLPGSAILGIGCLAVMLWT